MKGGQPGKGERLTPVHITDADREIYTSIQNKTMAQIRQLILREIEQIRELGFDEEADRLFSQWEKKIKTQKKDSYIMFYKTEILVMLDDAINNHPLLG